MTDGAPDLAPKVVTFLQGTCVFCQPWWLEAVSPSHWGVAVAKRGEEVAGVWPYAFKTRLRKYRLIEIPELTFYLGPWLRPSTAKSAKRLEVEKDVMTELVAALPPCATFHQWLHPTVTNWLPLYWKGFWQTTRYTYRLANTSDTEALWAGLKENIRTDIKKARKQLHVVEDAEADRFLAVQRATFSRQGLPLPFTEAAFRRLDAACLLRGVRRILSAVDDRDRVHASAYLVGDDSYVYSLLRGANPELRNSGASSLVVWAALEQASREGKSFDFVGSWVEPIERFVRAFGGQQVPFFEVAKSNSAVVAVYRAGVRGVQNSRQRMFGRGWD